MGNDQSGAFAGDEPIDFDSGECDRVVGKTPQVNFTVKRMCH